ncbi:hypothetical protein M9194_06990 [Vibrio sp. S4M6]|uniref:hypothetical protein n=1 Tax=Vibrio sinus TaxID=2946865 RepID=UPI00202A170F|nr:hypothetical protein [Vibrio sinus]MCL9781171.1 hypothetical protein [Vibrio sinus]
MKERILAQYRLDHSIRVTLASSAALLFSCLFHLSIPYYSAYVCFNLMIRWWERVYYLTIWRTVTTALAGLLFLLIGNLLYSNVAICIVGGGLIVIAADMFGKTYNFYYPSVIFGVFFFIFGWTGIIDNAGILDAITSLSVQTAIGTLFAVTFSQPKNRKRQYIKLMNRPHMVVPKLHLKMSEIRRSTLFSLSLIIAAGLCTLSGLPLSGDSLVPMIMLLRPEFAAGLRYGSNRTFGGVLFIFPSFILLYLLQGICSDLLVMLPIIALLLFALAYKAIGHGHDYAFAQGAAMILVILTVGLAPGSASEIFISAYQRSFGAILGLVISIVLIATFYHPQSILNLGRKNE